MAGICENCEHAINAQTSRDILPVMVPGFEPCCFECTGKAKWLYRLEATDPNNGLWYNKDCKLVWGIGRIEGDTKFLPMDYDERYHKDGRLWYSSCSRKEYLSHWYSLRDAQYLIANGFVFTRYLAIEYVEYEFETTFIKETSLVREVINIEDIWEINV